MMIEITMIETVEDSKNNNSKLIKLMKNNTMSRGGKGRRIQRQGKEENKEKDSFIYTTIIE